MNTENTSGDPVPEHKSLDEAIALFEGILQTMPEDRVALEALSMAYEQTGDKPRTCATLIRLAHVLVRKNEREAAANVANRLKAYANDDFEALEALRSIETMLAVKGPESHPEKKSDQPVAPLSSAAMRREALNREMSLAWELLQNEIITQDQYAVLIEDLSRLTAEDHITTISLLHAHFDRAMPGFEQLLQYLAKRCRTPIVPLSAFAPQIDLQNFLSVDEMTLLGALPFEKIGDEFAVGVLNPLDESLRSNLRRLLKAPCHFYLVTPEEFDLSLAKLRTNNDDAPTV